MKDENKYGPEFEKQIQEILNSKITRPFIKELGRTRIRRFAIFLLAAGKSVSVALSRLGDTQGVNLQFIIDELMDDYQLKMLHKNAKAKAIMEK